jgi:hypothetical protein
MKFLTDNHGKNVPKPNAGAGGRKLAHPGCQKNLPAPRVSLTSIFDAHTLPSSGPVLAHPIARPLHPRPSHGVDGHRAASRLGQASTSVATPAAPSHSLVEGGDVTLRRPAEGPRPSVSGEFRRLIRHGGWPQPEDSGCAHELADRVMHV